MKHYLVFVHSGRCQLLAPDRKGDCARRLTQIAMQEARAPESGELDLSEYEGCLLLVEGWENGEWIHSAQILDQCDAAMSAALLELLKNPMATPTKGNLIQ